MPLLDWHAPSGAPIALDRFWIYWAVTIPLTAAVLLLWSTWYLLSGSQRAQDRLERKKESKKFRIGREAPEAYMPRMCGLDRLRKTINEHGNNDTMSGMLTEMA